ncbi:MAG: ABC transporter substrate-binding protein, partial [Rickettsiaceae bacterium]|nr:ABC transporter substrate-binding protein [Rickettsiaceae bacterium]
SDDFKVFDVKIEGMSWIKSQKESCASILEHKSFEDLIADFKAKTN